MQYTIQVAYSMYLNLSFSISDLFVFAKFSVKVSVYRM